VNIAFQTPLCNFFGNFAFLPTKKPFFFRSATTSFVVQSMQFFNLILPFWAKKMRNAFGEIVKLLRRALNVSGIELIDLLASTASNGQVTKPSGNSIRMWSKKPPKRLQKAHVKLFRAFLSSWSGGIADEGAYREIEQILEEYFPSSKEINLADAEAAYRSYLVGDQEERYFLQNYEGCYVLIRHESGECNLRQDILVLKAWKNKFLATLITKNNVLRGFGVIVKGALSLSLGSNRQEMHPKTAASIILRRDANQINDMLGVIAHPCVGGSVCNKH
jgi:hypothetical protein